MRVDPGLVRREQEPVAALEGKPPEPLAELSLPEDTAWRALPKGISKDAARTQAGFFGNRTLAEKLLETVSIIA